MGSIERMVPRARDGCFFPSLLEPRKRAKQALASVVQADAIHGAYVQGVSTRRVYDLVQALAMKGIGKSQVSRVCQEVRQEVRQFRARSLDDECPDIWLDVTFVLSDSTARRRDVVM